MELIKFTLITFNSQNQLNVQKLMRVTESKVSKNSQYGLKN
jgi:hypothetical protein